MTLIIVSVYDRAAGAYGRPVFSHSEGLAVRSFKDEVNRKAPDNTMNTHPADFDLYVLGAFDDATGELTPCKPKLVLNGNSVIEVPAVLRS